MATRKVETFTQNIDFFSCASNGIFNIFILFTGAEERRLFCNFIRWMRQAMGSNRNFETKEIFRDCSRAYSEATAEGEKK